jgi:hypothetical protein
MNKVFLTWMAMFAAIVAVGRRQISAVAADNTSYRQQCRSFGFGFRHTIVPVHKLSFLSTDFHWFLNIIRYNSGCFISVLYRIQYICCTSPAEAMKMPDKKSNY